MDFLHWLADERQVASCPSWQHEHCKLYYQINKNIYQYYNKNNTATLNL